MTYPTDPSNTKNVFIYLTIYFIEKIRLRHLSFSIIHKMTKLPLSRGHYQSQQAWLLPQSSGGCCCLWRHDGWSGCCANAGAPFYLEKRKHKVLNLNHDLSRNYLKLEYDIFNFFISQQKDRCITLCQISSNQKRSLHTFFLASQLFPNIRSFAVSYLTKRALYKMYEITGSCRRLLRMSRPLMSSVTEPPLHSWEGDRNSSDSSIFHQSRLWFIVRASPPKHTSEEAMQRHTAACQLSCISTTNGNYI